MSDRALILGASTERSIGYHIGAHLSRNGYRTTFSSRSGRVGSRHEDRCDVTKQEHVIALFERVRPAVVVLGAGVFAPNHALEFMRFDERSTEHVLAKVLGTTIVIDAAARMRDMKHLILLGGRELSSDRSYALYTAANGALRALTRYANEHVHASFKTHLLDLPLVRGSEMGWAYFRVGQLNEWPATAITMDVVVKAALDIVSGKYTGERIVTLGEGWTV